MPKELTHWWLAAQAQHRLPPNSPTRHLLAVQQHAYLSGAVLPDTLLHLVLGRWSATALRLAHVFHQPAGNSYAPLVRFVEQQVQRSGVKRQKTASDSSSGPWTLDPAFIACLVGIAAHIEADIVFHPYICALSGNDIGQHYRYETELDLWLLKGERKPPVWRLKRLLTRQVSDVAVTVAQAVFDPGGELPPEAIRKALQLHSFIQGMYGSPGWQLLTGCLALLPVAGLRSRQNLFYPFNWRRGRSLHWPDRWLEPATGQMRHDTPEKLAEKAVERIGGLLFRVDQLGLLNAFKEQPGENLITGAGVSLPPDHAPTVACVTALQ